MFVTLSGDVPTMRAFGSSGSTLVTLPERRRNVACFSRTSIGSGVGRCVYGRSFEKGRNSEVVASLCEGSVVCVAVAVAAAVAVAVASGRFIPGAPRSAWTIPERHCAAALDIISRSHNEQPNCHATTFCATVGKRCPT